MRIYSRAEWGARYAAGAGPVRLPVRELWLHHTVTSAPAHNIEAEKAAMRSVEAIGQSRFGRGISYTFAVMPSGRVYEGTGAGRLGAHTGGRNSISHAIVLVGNYDTTVPSNTMLTGVADLVRHGHRSGWWQANRLTGGHRDVKATGCPGRHAYDRIGAINAMAASGAPSPATPPPEPKGAPLMVLFWHEGAIYATDGLYRSPWGLAPAQVDALVAGGVKVVGKPGDKSALFDLPARK
jgi:hypothetical protein